MTPIENQIESIVDTILEDYRHGRAIDSFPQEAGLGLLLRLT